MSRGSGSSERFLTPVRVAVDALVYAFTVAALVGVASLIVGIATGGGFVRGKALLFIAGWLILGYASFLLWPSSPDDFEDGRNGLSMPASHDTTRFQSLVQRLPPLRWMRAPPPDRRLTIAGKLFVSGALVLAMSFLMETVFGV